jgi:hypothetical protein
VNDEHGRMRHEIDAAVAEPSVHIDRRTRLNALSATRDPMSVAPRMVGVVSERSAHSPEVRMVVHACLS